MTPERWRRLRDVFDEALKHPPGERLTFVAQVCGGDRELRAEVGALVAADMAQDEDLAWIDQPLLDPARRILDEADPALPKEIGPYRLLATLGHGGMSSVYLAERESGGFQRRVAIKTIRWDLGGDQVLRRFRLERRILAGLDHPFIARLLDGGSTAQGWPYLVMEYVEGVPIDRYCETHGLSVDERLQLVRKVCEAVHHAHQNLVVHRDIKPSNVLVTTQGVPKLLDFGIAKLLNSHFGTSTDPATLMSMVPLTPGYASPEQLRGQPITTASDVYSLGVLIYQLLTGRLAHDVAGLAPSEIVGRMSEIDPLAPSDRVRADAVESDESGGNGGKGWARRLAGDLDAIVLMALRKEPGKRYHSAAQLAEDLDRFLSQRPVLARGNALGYRLAKLVRRNKLAAALAGVVALFAMAITVQAGRLSRALDGARLERARAVQEGQRARDVTELFVDLFEEAAPERHRGETLTVRQVLDRGAQRIPRLNSDPATQAALLDTLGRVYKSLGLYAQAGEHLEQALDVRREQGASAEVAESLRHLASLRLVQGDPKAAEGLSQSALAHSQRLFGPYHPQVATDLHNLAEVRHAQGRFEEAEALYREALDMRLLLVGPEHEQVAESLAELGLLLYEAGDLEAAESRLRQALALWRRLLGPRHPQVATALEYLALIHRARADYSKAEALFSQVLEMQRDILGPRHPDVATTLGDLGRMLTEKGDLEAAEATLGEAVALREELGEDPMLATVLNDLAMVYWQREDPSAAELLWRRALGIYRTTLGAEHPWVATVLVNLARSKRDQGDRAASAAFYREALALRRKVLKPGHRTLGYTLYELGQLHNRSGAAERAEPLLREGLDVMRQSAASGDPWTATLGGELGASLLSLGRLREAEALLLESYAGLEAAGPAFANRTSRARRNLALLYRRLGRSEEARAYAEGAPGAAAVEPSATRR